MRKIIPSSRAQFTARISFIDAGWAALAPLLVLLFRDPAVQAADWARVAALYWLVSFAATLVAFLVFRLQVGLKRYFSVYDALDVIKAVIGAELLICVVLFSVNRLEGIPRATIFFHAGILAAGLLTIRAFARHFEFSRNSAEPGPASEHIIVIGSNYLASLLIKMFAAYTPAQRRVVAVLDDNAAMIGRAIAGVPILGRPQDLMPIVDEFAIHGVHIDRVIVGSAAVDITEEALNSVRLACGRRSIKLEFLSQMLATNAPRVATTSVVHESNEVRSPVLALPSYFGVKRFVDFIGAAMTLVVLSPLFLCVCGLVFYDVGSPVLFRQLRQGRAGRAFLIYKFRTLQVPFDHLGKSNPDHHRQSFIGRVLRRTGLDELPQLFNVLVGDMSLIGPRPLLPRDQPPDPMVRLLVRPGITGWAQVNGAKLLTPMEKDQLDEWYIRNASLFLDLRIAFLTFRYVAIGQGRSERSVIDAHNQSKDERVDPNGRKIRQETDLLARQRLRQRS
jgi:lipopolysaccharide/colanic/teichoic acid biosynthesis glycosyltransferase